MSKPYITVLSYSGGVQSHLLLEMVLCGEIEKPFNFVVMNANPGMEDSRTYHFVNRARERCADAGIDFITAQGPNLYSDLVNSRFDGATRLDNPPYWTKQIIPAHREEVEVTINSEGDTEKTWEDVPETVKRGRLKQKCTEHYKLAVMDRALRHYLSRKHGISWNTKRLRLGLVEKWIGFAHDEWHRCSGSDVDYINLRFPLIELKMDKAKCVGWYMKRNLAIPPRSVCNACFANGLLHFKDMYINRPEDWDQAVAVDNALETWKGRITKEEVFVSSSLIRLRDLPSIDFGLEDEDMSEHHCNSGVCFV